MTYIDNNLSIKRIKAEGIDLFNSGVVSLETSSPYSNLFYPFITSSGGIQNNISVTIDARVENSKSNNIKSTYIRSDYQNIGHIPDNNLTWVFEECSNQDMKQTNIANAFCFCGQKINIKVARRGHVAGEIYGNWVFGKITLNVYAKDVVGGTETLLKSTNSFDLPQDDESRFFEYQIPNETPGLSGTYGIFGMVVLYVVATIDLYNNADFTSRFNAMPSITQRSFLQILTYSAAKEAKYVKANDERVNIFYNDVTGGETLEELFEKSVFANFDGIESIPLTTEQKKAVISDQVAVLFMSQHPVGSSDFYPIKILGLGGYQIDKPVFTKNSMSRILERQEDIISLAKNRMFGMLCNCETFGYSFEIDKYFSTFDQSVQRIIDPTRTLFVNEDGVLNKQYGTDGILFNPFVLEHIHAEMPKYINDTQEFNLKLRENNIDIDNISISDDNGDPITTSSDHVRVSFSVISGEEDIIRIRYSLWAHSNLIWVEHVDESGSTREHTFRFGSFGQINVTGSNASVTAGDIVNVRIDAENMNGEAISFYKDFFVPYQKYDPAILNVFALQEDNGSGIVNVYYNYLGSSEINNTEIKLYYSFDNSVWVAITEDVYGDIGKGIMPGFNTIKWYPWNIIEDIELEVFLKISISDVDLQTDRGKWASKSIEIPISIYKPEVAVRRLTKEEVDELNVESESTSTSSFSTSSSTESESSMDKSFSSSSSSFGGSIKNLILFIGDGMGKEHVDAASIYKTGSISQLLWQQFANQISLNTGNYYDAVPDSASAATAIATGIKVDNGVISINDPGDGTVELRTILEYAKENGKMTGLVSTSRITDATAAAFAAHEAWRGSEANIANDYLTQTRPNLLLGPTGTAMSEVAAQSAGYSVVTNKWDMFNLETGDEYMSGQFGATEEYTVNYDTDRPTLEEMTTTAIDVLKNEDNGFFLMVEGGLIDDAAHDSDLGNTINEVLELEKAVQVAYDFAQTRNDTMIIITSDHETGGLTIVTNNGIGVLPTVTWDNPNSHTDRVVGATSWGPQSPDLLDIDNLHHVDLNLFMMDKLLPLESTSSDSSPSSTSS